MANKKNKNLFYIISSFVILFNCIFTYIFYLNEVRDFKNYANRSGLMFASQIHTFLNADFDNLLDEKTSMEITSEFKKNAKETGLLNVEIYSSEGLNVYKSHQKDRVESEAVLNFLKTSDDIQTISRKYESYESFDTKKSNIFLTNVFIKDVHKKLKKPYILVITIDMTKEYNDAFGDIKLYSVVLFCLSFFFFSFFWLIIRQHSKNIQHYIKTINKQNEQALHLSQSKTDFLATMSHEIRTPINGFLGMLELLQDTKLNNKQKELVEIARYSGRHLMTILNDILDFSKIEAGQLIIENVPLDIRTHMEYLVKMNERGAKNKGVDLFFKNKLDPDLWILSDPVRIAQIIQNLMTNSIKFTHEGSVTLCIEYGSPLNEKKMNRIKSSKETHILFSVKDTGIGISEKNIENLFDKFTQADRSTTRKYGGTGLGLSITKKITLLLNGKIWVESIVGKGTIFYVLIPLVKTKKTQDSVDAIEGNLSKPLSNKKDICLKVLVVDDNIVNQLVFRGLLERDQHKVICVNSGKEALNLVAKEHFDIVFMDIQMPEMDGFEAAKKIRVYEEKHNKIGTFIAACSANTIYSQENGVEKTKFFNDEITKPIDGDKLRQLLKKVV